MGGSAIGVRFDVTVRGSLFLWRIAQEISRGVIFYDKFRCNREVKKRRCLYISSFFWRKSAGSDTCFGQLGQFIYFFFYCNVRIRKLE